jgi:hypothetical protein
MNRMRFIVILASATVIGACSDDSGTGVTVSEIPPLAFTRFVHGVPDTGATDWRFIDQLEFSPVELGRTFRQFSPYAGTAPGARRLRIFPTSTDINITQQFFIDSTFTLEAGKYYTIAHIGLSRTGQTPADFLLIMEDPIPTTVPATNFATRFVHLGTGLAGMDAYALDTTTTAVSGTPMFANVTFGTGSAYNANRATGRMAFRATNTGTTTVVASAQAPPGAAANVANNLTAVGGYSIGSSVFTGFLFPRSVAGSAAPQTTAFTSPAVIFLVDRHPKP